MHKKNGNEKKRFFFCNTNRKGLHILLEGIQAQVVHQDEVPGLGADNHLLLVGGDLHPHQAVKVEDALVTKVGRALEPGKRYCIFC